MKKYHHQAPSRILVGIFLVGTLALQLLPAMTANAAQITTRSLTLQAGATDGGSKPGGVVNHAFAFTLPGGSSVGSIKFEYCLTAAFACTMPEGLVTSTATLTNETGVTGFTSLDKSTPGVIIMQRTSAGMVAANTPVSYTLSTITNPWSASDTTYLNKTFYVRISTYASTDGSGSSTDLGVVTASTSQQIIIDGIMPESLIFCTGETIGLTGGVPDCSTATDGTISFDKLFSPTDTAVTSSQMAASTNASLGYVITVNGPTLTSGLNTIQPIGATRLAPVKGISQFGLNLRANTALTTTSMNVGLDVAPAADMVDYIGMPLAEYDEPDMYAFNSGAVVASSASGLPTISGASNAQIYTVSYIANVPGKQAAGTYTTTLTYICTPTF